MFAVVDMGQFFDLFMWFGVVAVLAVAGYLAAMAIRQRLLKDRQEEAFTLHDLRQMHARGELSDDEFDRMRAVMIGKAAAAKKPDGPGREEKGLGAGDLGDANSPNA